MRSCLAMVGVETLVSAAGGERGHNLCLGSVLTFFFNQTHTQT